MSYNEIEAYVKLTFDTEAHELRSSEPVHLDQLVKENVDILQYMGLHMLKFNDGGKPSKATEELLAKHGWYHGASEDKRDKARQFLPEYYVMNGYQMTAVNLDKIDRYQMDLLLKANSKIVMVVEPDSVLPKSVKDKIQAEVDKRKATAEKAAETRKKKAIAKAQAILEKNRIVDGMYM